jgi:hypothetical protein
MVEMGEIDFILVLVFLLWQQSDFMCLQLSTIDFVQALQFTCSKM